ATATAPSSSSILATGSAPETRTLLTFPTEGLPSPWILSEADLRAIPVRYPTGSAPAQAQINRWLCCRCAEEGYFDPVGMVHCPSPSPPPRPLPAQPQHRRHHCHQHPDHSNISHQAHDPHQHDHRSNNSTATATGGVSGSSSSSSEEGFGVCWRASCRHRKCVNCALYAGPLVGGGGGGGGAKAKLLIRTVGGLHASPRFVDPVYWECAGCGEWMRNRFDSRCTLGLTGCRNGACPFAWKALQLQLGLVGGGDAGGPPLGAGVLMAESLVMNRYGQRLGTADQRVAVADGPWDWQRRALGDARCAVVAGLRAAMRRTGDGMRFGSSANENGRSMSDRERLWKDGGPVPHYPYRRPPPLDENDAEENNEYEGSYLAGMSTEPLDKGKGAEQQYTAPSRSPRFCSTPSLVGANPVPLGFFPGWNRI
ncbi:hypothetical protein N657DRAFT_558714, partial [Parathielavia appendiculata]